MIKMPVGIPISDEIRDKAKCLNAKGESLKEIAFDCGISLKSVKRILGYYDVKTSLSDFSNDELLNEIKSRMK